jgi:hypothetical protein
MNVRGNGARPVTELSAPTPAALTDAALVSENLALALPAPLDAAAPVAAVAAVAVPDALTESAAPLAPR